LILDISQVIAHFVINFVAMATKVGSEKSVGSIRWPIPENPPIDANILQISHISRVIGWWGSIVVRTSVMAG